MDFYVNKTKDTFHLYHLLCSGAEDDEKEEVFEVKYKRCHSSIYTFF